MQLMRFTQEGYDALWAAAENNLPHYQAGDAAYFQNLIEENGWLEPTGLDVPDFAGGLQSVGEDRTSETIAAADRHNAPVLYEALHGLTTRRALAVDPKLWAALLHTMLFGYVCEYFRDKVAADRKTVGKNFFVTGNGQKRSIFVNCASRLWWACEFLYDENAEDPYHFLNVVQKLRFAGTTNLLSSGNIFENHSIVQGAYRVFEERMKEGKRLDRTKDMVEAYRYLNLLAGATVLDFYTIDEIADLVRKFFEVHDAQLPKKAFEIDASIA